jgi:CheY-like chemotaxis protein
MRLKMTPLVLVVDNEIGLLVLFSNIVERMGYRVLRADGGRAALDILEQQTPDVLVLDLAMPEITGYDVLRQVIIMPHLDAMRVMVLTATSLGPPPDDLEYRIAAWVTKPVHPDEFKDVMRKLAESSE